jgi:hypothetical protein
VIRVANVSAFLLRKVVNEVDYKGTGLFFSLRLKENKIDN